MTILRMPSVVTETGICRAAIYDAVKAGLFTKPVSIGQRSVGWPADEVRAINRARIAGKTTEQIKEVVQQLHTKRTELVD